MGHHNSIHEFMKSFNTISNRVFPKPHHVSPIHGPETKTVILIPSFNRQSLHRRLWDSPFSLFQLQAERSVDPRTRVHSLLPTSNRKFFGTIRRKTRRP